MLYRSLGERVELWITLNEPWVVMQGGYIAGMLAPERRDLAEGARVSQNLLLAHGQAVRAYRAEGRHAVGIAVNLEPKYPASGSRADREATIRADAYMTANFSTRSSSASTPLRSARCDCAAALRMRHGTSKSPWRPRARGD